MGDGVMNETDRILPIEGKVESQPVLVRKCLSGIAAEQVHQDDRRGKGNIIIAGRPADQLMNASVDILLDLTHNDYP